MRKIMCGVLVISLLVGNTVSAKSKKLVAPKIYGLASNKELDGYHFFLAVWRPVKKANFYQVEVADNKKFKNRDSWIEEDTYTAVNSVDFGKAYLRVRAVDQKNQVGKWSKILKVPEIKRGILDE